MSHKKSRKVYHHYPKSGVVKMPVLNLIVGIPGLAFMLFLFIKGLQLGSTELAAAGGALSLLPLWLIIAGVNWRITFDPVGFTYRNFFRFSRHYFYDDVTAIRFDKTTIVYIGKKKISVEELYDNRAAFLHSLKLHARHAERTEAKLFGGNIRNPEEFVFINWMMLAVILAIPALGIWGFGELESDDLTALTADITSCAMQTNDDGDEYLALYAEGCAEPLKVWNWAEIPNFAGMQAEIAGDTIFSMYYETRYHTPEEVQKTGAEVLMLTCDSHTHLSLDAENQKNRELRIFFLILGAVFLVFWGIYVAVSSYVMRHADRFPNAVRWFVKDSYIRKRKL